MNITGLVTRCKTIITLIYCEHWEDTESVAALSDLFLVEKRFFTMIRVAWNEIINLWGQCNKDKAKIQPHNNLQRLCLLQLAVLQKLMFLNRLLYFAINFSDFCSAVASSCIRAVNNASVMHLKSTIVVSNWK